MKPAFDLGSDKLMFVAQEFKSQQPHVLFFDIVVGAFDGPFDGTEATMKRTL